jgi:Lipid A 3-O-deacylase (PagL)
VSASGRLCLARHLRVAVFSFAAASFFLAPQAIHAQQSQPNNEFGVWGSYSANSPDVWGSRGHVQFGAVAFRYARLVHSTKKVNIEYTVDVEPVEIARENRYVPCEILSGGVFIQSNCAIDKQVVYAGGLSPFGWKFNLRPASQWQPLGALSGGFVMSQTAIPWDIPRATRFNFTFGFQAGVERFNVAHTRAWTFGYKLQHISNAFRSSINPGVDLNMLFVGYSFFR